MENRPITIEGDGTQTRDFVYVKDVARAHIQAADHDEATGRVFNIGSGVQTSLNQLVLDIEATTGRKLEVQNRLLSPGYSMHEFADITRAREVLGYSPRRCLRDGIREIIYSLE